MSLVAAIRGMLAKGLPLEQALEAAELIESREEARRAKKRAKAAAAEDARLARGAERSRRYRERVRDARDVTSRDITSVTVTPPKQKERVSPTPPLQEKLNPPLTVADATVVNGTPLTCELSSQKNTEDIEKLRQFGESWNTLARQLHFPQIDEIKPGSTRQRHALARLRDMTPDGVQGLMTRIRGSPYLRGEVNGFRVSFDWIINPSNYQKIMEGNYEVRKAAPLNGRGRTSRVL